MAEAVGKLRFGRYLQRRGLRSVLEWTWTLSGDRRPVLQLQPVEVQRDVLRAALGDRVGLEEAQLASILALHTTDAASLALMRELSGAKEDAAREEGDGKAANAAAAVAPVADFPVLGRRRKRRSDRPSRQGTQASVAMATMGKNTTPCQRRRTGLR